MSMNKALFSSENMCWETPKELFEKYDSIYHFETDVCALPENAKCKHFYSPAEDGLKQDWEGVCWMNPPYSREITKWVEKAYMESEKNGSTIVCLLPSRTDTEWFHKFVLPHARVEFIKGRVKFVGAKSGAPFPSVIAVFGRRA